MFAIKFSMEKRIKNFWVAGFFLPAINATVFNPKRHGGGLIQSIGQENACHFSQGQTMVTKFLDFVHKHPKYKVVK